jgi:hypothetical protein
VIICFVGERGAGKDTAAEALKQMYNSKTFAFADGLREVCKTVFGLTDHQMSDRVLKVSPIGTGPYAEMTVREVMQKVGTECFRDHFPGVWKNRLLGLIQDEPRVAIPDCRFHDEYQAVRERGAIFVRIDNPNVTETDSEHRSEIEWREFEVDQVLVNDCSSAEEFKLHVIDWYSNLRDHD